MFPSHEFLLAPSRSPCMPKSRPCQEQRESHACQSFFGYGQSPTYARHVRLPKRTGANSSRSLVLLAYYFPTCTPIQDRADQRYTRARDPFLGIPAHLQTRDTHMHHTKQELAGASKGGVGCDNQGVGPRRRHRGSDCRHSGPLHEPGLPQGLQIGVCVCVCVRVCLCMYACGCVGVCGGC